MPYWLPSEKTTLKVLEFKLSDLLMYLSCSPPAAEYALVLSKSLKVSVCLFCRSGMFVAV